MDLTRKLVLHNIFITKLLLEKYITTMCIYDAQFENRLDFCRSGVSLELPLLETTLARNQPGTGAKIGTSSGSVRWTALIKAMCFASSLDVAVDPYSKPLKICLSNTRNPICLKVKNNLSISSQPALVMAIEFYLRCLVWFVISPKYSHPTIK